MVSFFQLPAKGGIMSEDNGGFLQDDKALVKFNRLHVKKY
jgi:hypothetical protein